MTRVSDWTELTGLEDLLQPETSSDNSSKTSQEEQGETSLVSRYHSSRLFISPSVHRSIGATAHPTPAHPTIERTPLKKIE